MRKTVLFGALLALAAATIFAPALLAGDDPDVKVHAEIVSRTEHLDNFTDYEDTDSGSSNRDSYDFGFYRARVGITADVGDGITANITLQNHGNWGDTFTHPSNPQDPVLGGLWMNNLFGSNTVQLYEAWIQWANIGDSMVTAKLGRQEHILGNELHMGDADFYSGQYYDGLRLTFGFETWDLDAFYYWIQERNVLPGSLAVGDDSQIPGAGGSDDVTLAGLSADIEIADGHNIEPYALLYKQANEANLLAPKFNIWTIGALYDRPIDHDSPFDWSLEVAMQTGEIFNDDTDISSMVAEGWFGYTFGEEDESHHRVNLGFLMLGDGDDPDDVESFIPLFPDTHRRGGQADLFSLFSASPNTVGLTGGWSFLTSFHNFTDVNLGYEWGNGGSMSFGAAFHQFTATEDFGAPEDDLGSEVDLWFQHKVGKHLGMTLGVAQFMPGDFWEWWDSDMTDDVLRVYAQAKFRM